MAITRKLLRSLNLTDEVAESIIEAHAETVDALKTRIAELEQQASGYTDLVAERDQLQQRVTDLEGRSTDADQVRAEFDAYKAEVEAARTRESKRTALDALLRDKVGIQRPQARELILRATNLDDIALDEAGNIADADAVVQAHKEKYSDFVANTRQVGTSTMTPPPSSGGTMTKAEIAAMTDRQARYEAIARNIDQFD